LACAPWTDARAAIEGLGAVALCAIRIEAAVMGR
jgi:hypothetical protein